MTRASRTVLMVVLLVIGARGRAQAAPPPGGMVTHGRDRFDRGDQLGWRCTGRMQVMASITPASGSPLPSSPHPPSMSPMHTAALMFMANV